MTLTTDTLSPALGTKLSNQLEAWRRELVTLDRRQRLLYFKHTKSASLEILLTESQDAVDLVSDGGVRVFVDDEVRPSNALYVEGKTEAELKAGLRRLDQQSNQLFADRGTWTLYLTIGMLQWQDPQDDKQVLSPLILVPVRLTRNGPDLPYTLSRTDDEAIVNPVLRFKLDHDFGVTLPEVDPYDIRADDILEGVQKLVTARGWEVLERSVLTSFSFHKEAIYNDLKDNEDAVADSGLVQLLALGPDAPSSDGFGFTPPNDEDLDDYAPPEHLHNVLDADGSQRKCILAALDGKSFVMDGPPGTGKSQTIANMIAELIANGRSVLFVSEKAAALDVVRNRLTQASLGSYILDLHSSATTRKHFAEIMGASLRSRVKPSAPLSEAETHSLTTTRERLNGYALAMNRQRPRMNRSVHWALGKISPMHELAHLRAPKHATWESLTDATLADIVEAAQALGRAWAPVTFGDEFFWRDLSTSSDQSDQILLQRLVAKATQAAGHLVSRCEAVDQDLGLPLGRTTSSAEARLTLLRLLEHRPSAAPQSFLTAKTLDPVTSRAHALNDA